MNEINTDPIIAEELTDAPNVAEVASDTALQPAELVRSPTDSPEEISVEVAAEVERGGIKFILECSRQAFNALRYTPQRRIIALAMAASAVAACTPAHSSDGDMHPTQQAGPVAVSPALAKARAFDARLQARVDATEPLRNLSDDVVTYSSVRDLAAQKEKMYPEVAAELEQAADYAEASFVLGQVGYQGEAEIDAEVKEINDPNIRDDLVKNIAEAQEASQASDIVDGMEFETSTGKLHNAEQKLSKINGSVREYAEASLYAHYANQVIEDYDQYGDVSYKKSVEKLAAIDDPSLRGQALKVLSLKKASWNAYDYDTEERYYDAEQSLRDRQEQADAKLEAIQGGPSDDDEDAYQKKVRQVSAANEAAIDTMLTDYAKELPAASLEGHNIAYSGDPTEKIDFSTVNGGEKTNNDSYDFTGESDKALEPRQYNQFAEMHLEDGELIFRAVPQSGLKPEAENAMRSVTVSLAPMIIEAYKRGMLNGLHFVSVENEYEFNGDYADGSRDIYIEIPKSQMTKRALQTVVSHELSHALTAKAFSESKVGDEVSRHLSKTCSDIRATAFDDVQGALSVSESQIDMLEQTVEPGYRPVIKRFASLVKGRNLDNDKKLYDTTSGSDSAMATINDCLYMGLGGALDKIASELDIKLPDGHTMGDLLKENQAYEQLNSTWYRVFTGQTIYSLFDESHYLQTSNAYESDMGHSSDNAQELTGSLLDAGLQYPDELASTIAAMDTDKRKASTMALTITFQMARTGGSKEFNIFLKDRLADIKKSIRSESR